MVRTRSTIAAIAADRQTKKTQREADAATVAGSERIVDTTRSTVRNSSGPDSPASATARAALRETATAGSAPATTATMATAALTITAGRTATPAHGGTMDLRVPNY